MIGCLPWDVPCGRGSSYKRDHSWSQLIRWLLVWWAMHTLMPLIRKSTGVSVSVQPSSVWHLLCGNCGDVRGQDGKHSLPFPELWHVTWERITSCDTSISPPSPACESGPLDVLFSSPLGYWRLTPLHNPTATYSPLRGLPTTPAQLQYHAEKVFPASP